MRLAFFGTPDFAVPTLRALLGEGHDVVCVVTQPDRPQGRSRSTLVPPPVKAVALEEDIPVLQPERPRGAEFLAQLRSFAPDLSVVVAYGHILRQDVIDLPTRGTVNIHASLLPRWRGAAPIQAAILAGDAETGVSIQRMVLQLDAGPVLHELRVPLSDGITGGELTEALSELGAEAIIGYLALEELGGINERVQDESLVTYAPKIDRAMAQLDFRRPAAEVARAVRAFDPRPGAWGVVRDGEVRLFGVRVLPDRRGEPSEVLEVGEMGMVVACGSGAIAVETVHPAGRRRVAALDWYQGRGIAVGDCWELPA
ncbi:MAG: methionyl-tRNA formyltransferase [Gemmatimonadaceae bacterium]|nr:methionyl-tRNA formyltransferase [Gemmatimonadaceae bacterium]MCW5825838.1 methionyl-tRNA formyltransferase [Gemmatimonadaceae bacterium]